MQVWHIAANQTDANPEQGALQVTELGGQGSCHSCIQAGRVQPVGVVAGDHLEQLCSAECRGNLLQAPSQHLHARNQV